MTLLWLITWSGVKRSMSRSGTIRAFDVDFARCECEGTRHQKSGLWVIAVRWKRKPCGKTRFSCMRCKGTWSMNDIPLHGDGISVGADHPEEIARRYAIDPDFNLMLAVNIKTSHAYCSASEL